MLTSEEEGVFALEIEPNVARDSIAWISERDGLDWQRTLQFRARRLRHALFRGPKAGSKVWAGAFLASP